MKKLNFDLTLGVAFVSLLTAMSCIKVGEAPQNLGPFEWTLPLKMFVVLGAPLVLGYRAGKASGK